MRQINAINVVKTLRWISQIDDDSQTIFEPKLNKEGIYECAINLPFINKAVIGLGDNKLDSIDNATRQTAKLIDQYVNDNPWVNFTNSCDQADYFLQEDENGNLSIRVLPKGDC